MRSNGAHLAVTVSISLLADRDPFGAERRASFCAVTPLSAGMTTRGFIYRLQAPMLGQTGK